MTDDPILSDHRSRHIYATAIVSRIWIKKGCDHADSDHLRPA